MNPFELKMPDVWSSSFLFASPHSGRGYSQEFLRKVILDETEIRSSEDAFVDVLFGISTKFGSPFLAATAPRAYVDLNRSADELDPALIEGVRAATANPRVSSGLGVVPRVVSNGRAIYRGKLSLPEAKRRLDRVWHPYHAMLQEILTESTQLFGEAVLIDCHSMPHEAIESISHGSGASPEVVLGDRFGAAADAVIVDQVEAAFAGAGFNVARNSPFAGAYMAQHYGRPSRGQHVIQVEIDRSLYMNEKTITPNADFADLRTRLAGVVAEIAEIGRGSVPLAAE